MQIDPKQINITEDRQRKDLGDLSDLKSSIARLGILQPLLVTPEFQLICGERRLRCALSLGLDSVPVYIKGTVTPDDAEEMELEENVRRKSLSWQEQVCAIARLHKMRQHKAALSSTEWGLEHTGELVGLSTAAVCYSTKLAEAIVAGDKDIIACTGVRDAYTLLVERRLTEARKTQAQRLSLLPTKIVVMPEPTSPQPTAPPADLTAIATPVVVPTAGLSVKLYNTPWNKFAMGEYQFDHIYTDPPYAIDMDNLQQDGIGMNVDLVRDTHDVEENMQLLHDFFGWACRRLARRGFMVVWCDYMMWRELYNAADSSAAVAQRKLHIQRWPYIWVKENQACQNGMPYSNFTKTHECAIVIHGEDATLTSAGIKAHWKGANDKSFHKATNPFWKPILMHQDILEAVSQPGQIILDPFAGSGSIPYAALRCGRSVVANEMDPVHYNDMFKRLHGDAVDDAL